MKQCPFVWADFIKVVWEDFLRFPERLQGRNVSIFGCFDDFWTVVNLSLVSIYVGLFAGRSRKALGMELWISEAPESVGWLGSNQIRTDVKIIESKHSQ